MGESSHFEAQMRPGLAARTEAPMPLWEWEGCGERNSVIISAAVGVKLALIENGQAAGLRDSNQRC